MLMRKNTFRIITKSAMNYSRCYLLSHQSEDFATIYRVKFELRVLQE